MSNGDLKVGDRVRLSPNTKWRIGENNPLDVLGKVTSVTDVFIRVIWDNGRTNRYYHSNDDLILVESLSDDPSNITLSDAKW